MLVKAKLRGVKSNITSVSEIRDIIIADIVLTFGFSLAIAGGVAAFQTNSATTLALFESFLPIAAVGVTLNFVLHELMHKFLAQRYGAMAEFRTIYMGLVITIFTSLFGFLLGMPGATFIYTNSFTKKQNGLVSLIGPLTNLAIFVVFLALSFALNPPANSYLATGINFIIYISVFLAFFNMLPISPLDGSKVLRWNIPIYVATMGTILLLLLVFTGIGWETILLLVGIALVISLISRTMF